MVELFMEFVSHGEPVIERVLRCGDDFRLQRFSEGPACEPVTYESVEQCRYSWFGLLAAEDGHYRNREAVGEIIQIVCVRADLSS